MDRKSVTFLVLEKRSEKPQSIDDWICKSNTKKVYLKLFRFGEFKSDKNQVRNSTSKTNSFNLFLAIPVGDQRTWPLLRTTEKRTVACPQTDD